MPSRTLVLVCVVAAANLILLPCLVRGADGDPVDEVSFLDVLYEGAEWPGVFIGFMSLASVTIIIEHFWTIRRATMIPESEIEIARELIENRKFKECIDYIRGRESMFADVLTAGLRHGRHGFEAMQEAAEERASAWSSRLFRKVEYLNIIGNLGPLMGLLGTVLGMIRAFSAMQATHGAYKPEDLAGGIGLALVNTFLGLAVAIVSLGFFGVCRNRVDALTVSAHAGVVDLMEYFRPATLNATGEVQQAATSEPKKEA
ncbi:MAG: MotA/TolQ/ExbB proton channel family protein [Phycisphaerae bacterium]|nr:MotA/TolQ/ExbB proton channel family protein [Phycisphaerae bacterium]